MPENQPDDPGAAQARQQATARARPLAAGRLYRVGRRALAGAPCLIERPDTGHEAETGPPLRALCLAVGSSVGGDTAQFLTPPTYLLLQNGSDAPLFGPEVVGETGRAYRTAYQEAGCPQHFGARAYPGVAHLTRVPMRDEAVTFLMEGLAAGSVP